MFLKNLFKRSDKPNTPSKLYGFDIVNEWNYLGRMGISIKYTGEYEHTKNANVFYFCSKYNTDIRDYVIKRTDSEESISMFINHKFIITHAELWKACGMKFYNMFLDSPSAYLRNYMKEKFNYIWDYDKEKWVEQENGDRE